jgi:hypothetical protein
MFGKNLVDAGVSPEQVAALLGQERLDTVMIYTKPSQGDLEKAVRKAACELNGRPPPLMPALDRVRVYADG